jgi:16S rRNA (cytosine1402-N4)-methyltransferase
MSEHQSVLLHEAIDALITRPDGLYVDGTFGRGGHSRLILQKLEMEGRLLVIDKDPQALSVASQLAEEDSRVLVRHGSFADMSRWCEEQSWAGRVTGILLDLGVSSPQLDDPDRGFSFSKDGPLDMRMDTSTGMTAEAWINSAKEEEIANVLYEYGEERFSRRMARAIVQEREQSRIQGTLRLAEIIKQANPAWEKHKHPATRAFQGIRIFINRELEDLDVCLQQCCKLLENAGRLVVISFHSLEDRMVKQFIQREEKGNDFPPGVPVMESQLNKRLRKVGKAIKAGSQEVEENPRARSAVMRVAERLPHKEVIL